MNEDRQREARRDARLFALLCNLMAGRKKTWKEEDFLAPTANTVPPESEEARQAIEAYRARVAAGRRAVSSRTD